MRWHRARRRRYENRSCSLSSGVGNVVRGRVQRCPWACATLPMGEYNEAHRFLQWGGGEMWNAWATLNRLSLFSKIKAGLEIFFSCLEKFFSSVEKSFSSVGKNFSKVARFSWKYYEALECFVVRLYKVDNSLIAKGKHWKNNAMRGLATHKNLHSTLYIQKTPPLFECLR